MDDEAESAIRCFEADTGLPVVVHDLDHRLWTQLPTSRYRHRQPFCLTVKNGGGDSRCKRFEIDEFRRQAPRWCRGRLHRCHAGAVEWALPVFDDGHLLLVLFAGPSWLADASQLDHDEDSGFDRPPAGLPEIVCIAWTRERLLQLGSRLRCLCRDAAEPLEEAMLPRQRRIERFIERRYAEPIGLADLARHLGLGVERCRHVVAETCDTGFATLLKKTRIRAACALLLNTGLSVAEVGERCGLADPSGFNRAFRSVMNASPGSWRRCNRV